MGFDLIARSPSSNRQQATRPKDRLIADATANGGFATIPNALLQANGLRPNERLVLIVLISWTRADQLDQLGRRVCRVGLKKIEEGTGLHRATVKRALAGLVAKQMIRRARQKAGASITTITWAHCAPTSEDLGAESAHLGAESAHPGRTERPPWDHHRSHLEELRKVENKDLEKSIDPVELEKELIRLLPNPWKGMLQKLDHQLELKHLAHGMRVTLVTTNIGDRDYVTDSHLITSIERQINALNGRFGVRFYFRVR